MWGWGEYGECGGVEGLRYQNEGLGVNVDRFVCKERGGWHMLIKFLKSIIYAYTLKWIFRNKQDQRN